MPIKKTRFSKNWNNKLDCLFFTTIRLDTDKYRVGDTHIIELADVQYKRAEILDIKRIHIDQIPNYTAWLDMGYNSQEAKRMLRRMYAKKVKDWATQKLALIIFKTV